MVIKTKRFYANGKSCKVELKKEGLTAMCTQRLQTSCMRCRNLTRFKKVRNRDD